VLLTPGQAHDNPLLIPVLEAIAVPLVAVGHDRAVDRTA
jgi:hypothetical protein